jgi:tetratricopeptide (TPR) repeat protein
MEQNIVVQLAEALLRWGSLGRLGTRTVRREVRKLLEGVETADDARAGAIARAKRQILDELGAYLEQRGGAGTAAPDPEDAVALSSGLMQSQVVKDSMFRTPQGQGVRIVVKGRLSTLGLNRRVQRLVSDPMQLDRLKAVQRRNDALLGDYAQLEARNRGLTALGRPGEARELRKAFEETTRKLAAQEWLAKVQALWDGLEYRDAKLAIDYINEAIRLVPDYPLYHFFRGNANYYWRQYPPALRDYSRAIELEPRYAEAFNNRGNVHYREENYARATADYDQAVTHHPGYADAFNNRGNAFYKQGRYEEALADYARALALDPDSALYHNNRAITHDALGDSERALADYGQAIALEPTLAIAYCNRGRTHATRGDHRAALDDFNRAIAQERRLADAYFERGNAYRALGHHGAAQRDWRKAAKLGHRERGR